MLIALPPQFSLSIATGLAIVDAMNPSAIGVLILLMTVLLKGRNRNLVIARGIAFALGMWSTHFIGGLILLQLLNAARIIFVSQILYLGIGAFLIFLGMLEIKDFFWYGRWFLLGIPKRFVSTIETKARGASRGLWASFTFGVILALIELPSTGAPYLGIITLMSKGGYTYFSALPLLLYYNVIFVFPLIVIIFLAYRGFAMKRLEEWRQEHRGAIRMYIGLFLLMTGIWIVTAVIANALVLLLAGVAILFIIMAFSKYILRLT